MRHATPARLHAVATFVFLAWVSSAVCLMAGEPGERDQPAEGHREWTRVRPLDRRGARAIEIGYAESPTVRALVDEIEQSDLVVYIDTEPFRAHSTEAFLQFMSTNGGLRYAIAWVDPRHDERDLVALVGHELQHAVELARACDVTTPEEFLAFYRAHGHASGTRQYETATAHDATARIQEELAKQLAANLARPPRD